MPARITGTPPADTGGSPVTGYQLEVSRQGGAFTVLATDLATQNHLDVAAQYGDTYRWRAKNALGYGQPGPTVVHAAAGALDLPRVEWEGGPSYYEQFASVAGTEWTTDAFFPIIYWGAYLDEQAKVTNDAALGINAVSEIYAPAQGCSTWLRNAGIWNLGYNPDTAAGSEWVGRFLPDEADMWGGPGWNSWDGVWGFGTTSTNCGYTVVSTSSSSMGAPDGRMRYYNGGKGMLMWQSDADGRVFANGFDPRNNQGWPLHLLSGDLYFYTDGDLYGGDPQLPGQTTTYFGRPRELIRRAGNYGELAQVRIRTLEGLDGARKPTGILVELGQQTNTTNTGAMEFATMTPDKVEGAVWSTLIHEARFVSYFSHSFGTQPTSDALNHPPGDAHYDAVKARVSALNAKITGLAPVLNTQSYVHSFNPNLATMLKVKSGSAYVFAQQKVSATTSGSYTFTLPAGIPTSGTVEVLHESRTIPYSGGQFTDSFAQEFTHHIYRLPLGG